MERIRGEPIYITAGTGPTCSRTDAGASCSREGYKPDIWARRSWFIFLSTLRVWPTNRSTFRRSSWSLRRRVLILLFNPAKLTRKVRWAASIKFGEHLA